MYFESNIMKKILGLDLGSASIGWAVIEIDESGKFVRIVAMGSRVIPYNGTEGQDFSKGTGESRNSLRTKMRTTRKGYDRYQQRRKYLVDILIKNNMMPGEALRNLPKMKLWELRSEAASKNVSRQELGRLLLWLNQKRGYKSSRSDANLNKKDSEYLIEVKRRFDKIKDLKFTIGQYFYNELCCDEYFRIKENIFPREAYLEEFDKICSCQKDYLGLSDELIAQIRNKIIYYQRPLKSQKGLVSVCEFEGFWIEKCGKDYFVGPKVASKSSPLFQIAKIWENINNIQLGSKKGEIIKLTNEEKLLVFEYLDNNEKLTVTELFKLLNKNKNEYTVTKQLEKGLNGNITRNAISKILNENEAYRRLLKLDFNIVETDNPCYLYAKKTGEILGQKNVRYISSQVENEPFYQLWHTIYSIDDVRECSNALQNRFEIDKNTADKLAGIDFIKYGFGNKSVKVIRKILPYLMEGDAYSEAMSYAGYNHSSSMTNEENSKRKLLDELKPIEKNSLRQPIVEKILNQMVNVVNAIIKEHGKPSEIRIELARELKQSKEERNETDKRNNKRQSENENIAKRLAEYNLRATRNNIIKWRLYEEIDNQEKKLGAICVYCGQPISLTEAITGSGVEIEHIIPKSKLFDDSQSNKTLAHHRCNSKKNDMTAYDFMKTKSEQDFNAYIERVNLLFSNHIISKAKRDKFLMSENQIPNDFIDRQLRESQYIARKAHEILQTICSNVWSTSGTITAELRHLWGWDDATMNLQIPKYKELGLTEIIEWKSEHGKNKYTKEIIKDWTKRDDHRHHAIDALVIACTKQSFIQRFNTLNASKTQDDMKNEIGQRSLKYREKLSLLEKYIISQRPIDIDKVEKSAAKILISYKSGKRVAVRGKRKIYIKGNANVVQEDILIPRGALHEDGIYGNIKKNDMGSPNNEMVIVKKYKLGVGSQGFLFTGKETVKDKVKINKKTGAKQIVVEDKVLNAINSIVDKGIRRIVLDRLNRGFEKGTTYKDDVKKAFDNFRNLENDPVFSDKNKQQPIRSVRCFTGLSAVVPVKKDSEGKEIGYVKPGNNHHIAIYTDENGKKQEHICTFWHAVERKKYNLPVIISNTNEVWDRILVQPDNTYPDSFLQQLPPANLEMVLSLQQNEMLILGMNNEEVENSFENKDYNIISEKLYRVQSLSEADYWFRHHLETKINNDENSRLCKRFFRVRSLNALFNLNPLKVKIDYLGNIIKYNIL